MKQKLSEFHRSVTIVKYKNSEDILNSRKHYWKSNFGIAIVMQLKDQLWVQTRWKSAVFPYQKKRKNVINVEECFTLHSIWGDGRQVSPASLRKMVKKRLNFWKNAVISVIYGLSFSFKVQFLKVSRRKKRRFFLAEPFFFVL